MSVAAIFVLLAVTVGVLAFVLWPLISRSAVASGSPSAELIVDPALPGLLREYQGVLGTVRDLDFDFQTGKLLTDDYQQQRVQLTTQGADLLRQIDLLKARSIESAVAARRQSGT